MVKSKDKKSMFVGQNIFDVVEGKYGSGWAALNVELKSWHRHESTGDSILLTHEVENYAEFEHYIEELKFHLDELKPKAKRHFLKMKKESSASD
ncbi:hypothetical protein [Celeribacter sp.]|uniref:hypothetical protein n=1 Tax=Celeribacter sp. TaxID=1890673 RepID=UPI003A8F5C87